MDPEAVERFRIADYIVFTVLLSVSVSIGIYHACSGGKQKTTSEYLLGNRNMWLLPVAVSMFVTFQSAIAMLGIPTEMYQYGTMYMFFTLGQCIAYVVAAYVAVPLLHPLKIMSTNEYLELRFSSRAVRYFGTISGIIQTIVYMGVVLFAPSLALEAVVGFPLWVSVVVVGVVGTFYTTIGGFKSVIWTDVFQSVIMVIGAATIIIQGTITVGGVGEVWSRAYDGGRLQFFDGNPDPRTRHTQWSLCIGGTFSWMIYTCFNQASVQRIASIKTLRSARMAMLINIPTVLIFTMFICYSGIMAYAYFAQLQCDPLKAGQISSANQVMPYFVMTVFRYAPGFAGLYVATIFSAALSTLSSGLNGLATNTLEDIIRPCFKSLSEFKATLVAKALVIVYGVGAICIAYIAQSVSGPVTQLAIATSGALGGPVLGIFLLGAFLPISEWIGALSGGLAGIIVSMWIGIGAKVHNIKTPPLPPAGTEGCFANMTNLTSNTAAYFYNQSSYYNATSSNKDIVGDKEFVPSDSLYALSYLWYAMVGVLVTVIVGSSVSLCASHFAKKPTDPVDRIYIHPVCRRFVKVSPKRDCEMKQMMD